MDVDGGLAAQLREGLISPVSKQARACGFGGGVRHAVDGIGAAGD